MKLILSPLLRLQRLEVAMPAGHKLEYIYTEWLGKFMLKDVCKQKPRITQRVRRFGNLCLPSSVIIQYKGRYINAGADRW